MSQLSEYIEQQTTGGKILGSNEKFVVHLTKAREKMAIFQEQEPAHCFLKWYQAAVVGGAKEIFFEMDKDCYVMVIPFTEEPDLAALCEAFDGDDSFLERRDRLFLEGLLSATSAEMETSVSTAQEQHVFSAGGLQQAGWWSKFLGKTGGAYKKNSVQIRTRMLQSKDKRRQMIETIRRRTRFGPIICHFALDISKQPSLIYDEVPLLDSAWRRDNWSKTYSTKKVLLEHWSESNPEEGELARTRELIEAKSKCAREPDSLLSQCRDQGGIAVVIGLDLVGSATFIPVQHGVTLAPLHRDLGCPGVVVVFACEGLETDLSGFDLRKGDSLQQKLEVLKSKVNSVVDEHLPKIREVDSNVKDKYFLGMIVGALIGFYFTDPWGFATRILVSICLAAVGYFAELTLRRDQIKKNQELRTLEFRRKLLERLDRE